MALFSERLSLARASEIVDSAPRWFRSAYYRQVLERFIANDFVVYHNRTNSVCVSWLIPRLGQLLRAEVAIDYTRADVAMNVLYRLLVDEADWFFFYDVVEIVAAQLKKVEIDHQAKSTPKFKELVHDTNEAFKACAIGWRLNWNGQLERSVVEEASVAEAQLALLEKQDPARLHIGKAKLMLNQRPCDSANIIKESVSAIESAGRTAYPECSTLGDVIKTLRSRGNLPPLFLSLLEKLYAFANAEPGVRHGSDQGERVTRAEAEFVYTTSMAIISYLSSLAAI